MKILRKTMSFLKSLPFLFFLNLVALIAFTYVRMFSEFGSSNYIELLSITSNLLQGGFISFVFYFLVVFLPERRKKNIIKNNLIKTYREAKKDIIWQVMFASKKGGREDIELSTDTAERLMNLGEFRDTFKDGKNSNEGFYAFQNQMSFETPEFRAIVSRLNNIQRQLEYILNNYDIQDQKLFDYVRGVENYMYELARSTPGYDESKPLCSFVWQICTGWDPMHGYHEYDFIEKNIQHL